MSNRIGDLSVQDLSGIGAAFSDMLQRQGVSTIQELSECSAKKLARSSKYSAAKWVAQISRAELAVQAQGFLDGLASKKMCSACQGTGEEVVIKETKSTCATCQGKGSIHRTRKATCASCSGTGSLTSRELRGCATCGGTGKITVKRDVTCQECGGVGTLSHPCMRTRMVTCPRCKGSGIPMFHWIIGGSLFPPYILICISSGFKCAKCDGDGEVEETYPSTINLPCEACGGDGVAVVDEVASCPECGGTKKVAYFRTTACKNCNKTGVTRVNDRLTCSSCAGSGESVETVSVPRSCRVCGGTGGFTTENPFRGLSYRQVLLSSEKSFKKAVDPLVFTTLQETLGVLAYVLDRRVLDELVF